MAKMSQTDVFQEIILERIYQDSKWGTIEDHPHEVGSWLVIMDRLLAKAKNGYMTSVGDYTDFINNVVIPLTNIMNSPSGSGSGR